jgi:GxxExxY protein
MELNQLSGEIINAAMKIHSLLGPGLLENAYKNCLAYELRKRSLKVEIEIGLPLIYESVRMDVGYSVDMLVEDSVIVELKSVEALSPVHHAQHLCYLKLSGKKLGLLINFNVLHLRDGIKRMANGL